MSKCFAVILRVGNIELHADVDALSAEKARAAAVLATNGTCEVVSVTERPKAKKMKTPMSRPERWAAAAQNARDAYDAMSAGRSGWEDAMGELSSLKDEYEEWQGSLPENLQDSALGEKLEAITGMDFETLPDLDDCESLLEEIKDIELPRGYGRD
ncbi:MAG: hypothetical protein WC729_29905 [Sphingomonas sp.]|jgi:hypothetical protein|uniref:hypothetical protein n=1 Tax=Sphingomonas sp. TaxID=28214 RepID=UPI0035652A6C